MSIIIEGMEMPGKGTQRVMFITIDSTGLVELLDPDTNTLIEEYHAATVPQHGDLIDLDVARESIKPWSPEDERNACTFDTVKKLMYTMLSRAPVVIPANVERLNEREES